MIERVVVWRTQDGQEPLQVSVALLDDYWEPLREVTLPCGPFHPEDQQLAAARHQLRTWVSTYGVQLELDQL